MKTIDKIYIIHYNKLVDRKAYLKNEIPKLGISFEFIENSPETDEKIKSEINYWYKYREGVTVSVGMSLGEIGVSISHLYVYEDIINKGYDTCLILEDDAVLVDDFKDKLLVVLDEINDYDFVFLSSCCNLNVEKSSEKILYEVETSRSVCGYIVQSKKLPKVLINSIPVFLPIDWYLNYIKKEMGLKYAWSQPILITQGSELKYKSNLR